MSAFGGVVAARKHTDSKGGRPPAFDAESDQGHNVVERRYCDIAQWRGVATRYDKLAVAVAVVSWLGKLSDTP